MAARSAKRDLIIRFLGDTKSLDKAFSKINKNVNGFRKKSASAFKGAEASSRKFSDTVKNKVTPSIKKGSSAASGFLSRFGSMGGVMTGILGPLAAAGGAFLLLKGAISSVITAGRFAEDTITTLGVALGSERAGVEAFKKSLDFSVVTPFDPRAVAQATELAVSFGIRDPFQKGVNNLAKGTSLVQLAAGIASFSQDKDIVNSMKNLLTPESEVIKKWGGDVFDLWNEIIAKKIKIGSREFQAAWLQGLSAINRFQEAAGKAARTVTGLTSTIQGNLGNIALFFTGAAKGADARTFWNFFRDVLADISDSFSLMLERAGPVITEIGTEIGAMMRDFFGIAKALVKIMGPGFLAALLPTLVAIGAGFTILRVTLRAVVSILSGLFKLTSAVFNAFAKITGLDKVFGKLSLSFGDIGLRVQGFFIAMDVLFDTLDRKIDALAESISSGKLFKALSAMASKLKSVVGSVGEFLSFNKALFIDAPASAFKSGFGKIFGGGDEQDVPSTEQTPQGTQIEKNSPTVVATRPAVVNAPDVNVGTLGGGVAAPAAQGTTVINMTVMRDDEIGAVHNVGRAVGPVTINRSEFR